MFQKNKGGRREGVRIYYRTKKDPIFQHDQEEIGHLRLTKHFVLKTSPFLPENISLHKDTRLHFLGMKKKPKPGPPHSHARAFPTSSTREPHLHPPKSSPPPFPLRCGPANVLKNGKGWKGGGGKDPDWTNKRTWETVEERKGRLSTCKISLAFPKILDGEGPTGAGS